MSRLIHDRIKQPLASEILFGKLAQGGSVEIKVVDDKLELDIAEKQLEPAA